MATATWHVMLELAPWLLFGALIAGLLHGLLPAGLIRKRLRGRGAVWRAVAFGVPLPLCSCGVIPAGIGLKKDGASNGAAMGFLISTPQTGVDSILLSAGFLGWPFALYKVLVAAVTGIVGGKLADLVAPPAEETARPPGGSTAASRGVGGMLSHGIEVIRSVWKWLVVGVLISAAIEVWLPPTVIGHFSDRGSLLAAAAVLLVSLPMYVCATSSIPIAAALVAKGLPTGAALVFLMAGPATNVATIGAIYRTFGRKLMAVYLVTVVGGSLGAAVLFDALMPAGMLASVTGAHDHGAHWILIKAPAALLLIGLFAWFAIDELRGRFGRMTTDDGISGSAIRLDVEGMTCQDCVRKLESTLSAASGVTAANARLSPGQVTVHGSIDEAAVRERIRAAGFEPANRE